MTTVDALVVWNIETTMNNESKYEKFMQNFDAITDDALDDAITGDDFFKKQIRELEDEVKGLEKEVKELEDAEIDLEDEDPDKIEEQYFINAGLNSMVNSKKIEMFHKNIDKFSEQELESFLKFRGAVIF